MRPLLDDMQVGPAQDALHPHALHPDAALIEACLRGDHTAFGQIIERYQRAVYAVSYSSVRDHALSDDLTQDTFVTAWRRLADLRDVERLPAWLCGIARNLGRDARKRLGREVASDASDTLELAEDATPFDALSDAESERLVATALETVPEAYREPLVLFYYEQRCVKEVARALGITEQATHQRLSRGRQLLAERVTSVVERGLARRGPRVGLAASVLAAIGVTVPSSHVDASPTKGSTMPKIGIAVTLAAATLGGAGLLVATSTNRDVAHAAPAPRTALDATAAATHTATASKHTEACAPSWGSLRSSMSSLLRRAEPSLAASSTDVAQAREGTPDCSAVARHLADLDADSTHGPAERPGEDDCQHCINHYLTECTTQQWSPERRACMVAASDIINARVTCARADLATDPAAAPSLAAEIPARLACSAIATHAVSILQAHGLYVGIPDMPAQVASACDAGSWSLEIRDCLVRATTPDDLHACIE